MQNVQINLSARSTQYTDAYSAPCRVIQNYNTILIKGTLSRIIKFTLSIFTIFCEMDHWKKKLTTASCLALKYIMKSCFALSKKKSHKNVLRLLKWGIIFWPLKLFFSKVQLSELGPSNSHISATVHQNLIIFFFK